MAGPMRTAVLVSGSGTNLQALLDAEANRTLSATISLVISNKPNVASLERAHRHHVTHAVISHHDYATREVYDHALVQCLREHHIELVVLAGFMRIVTPVLLDAFPARVINIHPSLLPAFPGMDAQAQALAHGVRITGCTTPAPSLPRHLLLFLTTTRLITFVRAFYVKNTRFLLKPSTQSPRDARASKDAA
jgi:phosphoribosylglycinamide formyltransferase 1